MEGTNYRHAYMSLDKDYIGAFILPDGNPIDVVISHVKEEDVKVGGHDKHTLVAYFEENDYFKQPFLLSAKCNIDALIEWYGTPNFLAWGRLKVTLQQELSKNPKGGAKIWALRIKKKPELNSRHAFWNKTIEWLKEDSKHTIAALKSKFVISEANVKILEGCQKK